MGYATTPITNGLLVLLGELLALPGSCILESCRLSFPLGRVNPSSPSRCRLFGSTSSRPLASPRNLHQGIREPLEVLVRGQPMGRFQVSSQTTTLNPADTTRHQVVRVLEGDLPLGGSHPAGVAFHIGSTPRVPLDDVPTGDAFHVSLGGDLQRVVRVEDQEILLGELMGLPKMPGQTLESRLGADRTGEGVNHAAEDDMPMMCWSSVFGEGGWKTLAKSEG